MRDKLTLGFGFLGTALAIYNLYLLFFVLPDEAMQGAIYRILFFHAPAAIAAYFLYFGALVGSVVFLIRKNFFWDSLAVSCVEVAVVFTLLNLVTGSLWGRVIWGIYWTWDVRLTSQLICFVLYLGYLLLRPAVTEPTQRATMSAILAIFAFADIPIVWYSIRWHNARTQHPAPVLETGGLAPEFKLPFLLGFLAMMAFGLALVMIRQRQETAQLEMDAVRRELHAA